MQQLIFLARTWVFICLLSGIYFSGNAQQLGRFDIRKGVEPFYLGSTKKELDSSINLVESGKLEYKGRTEYSYSYPAAVNQPYCIGGICFKNLILVYISDTLIRISFLNMYLPNLYPDYDKRAKKDFRRISEYLENEWRTPGRTRTFLRAPDNRVVSKGLQWNTDGKAMKLALYEDRDKKHRLFDISITLEYSRFD